ncbi:ABC transporter permease [Streptomyces mirabilis]
MALHQEILTRFRAGQTGTTASPLGTLARLAPGVALVLLLIVGFIATPDFVTGGNIKALLTASAILAVLAVGQAFVMSTAGIDLSVPAVAQMAGVLLGMAVAGDGWPVGLSIVFSLAAGAAAGAVSGLIVARGKIGDFIVTLGSFSVLTGFTLLLSDGKPRIVRSGFLTEIATGSLGPISYLPLIALGVAVIGWITLFHTAFGTHVLAIGGNKDAADALGLSFTRIKVAVYAIAGLLSALGGILLVARLGAAEPTAGSEYQLTSVAAAVLGGVSLFGGKSSIAGPVVGAVVLTGILNLLNLKGVDPYYQPIAVGTVVVLSAIIRRYETS